ncbi:hypothetical protein LOZ65_006603 [Ophidiomyces ophidiicola]|nr:hypothetical protein LOZ65_006603 [Ophidiomyces ophidiicola]
MPRTTAALHTHVDRRPRRDQGIERPDGYYLQRLEEHRARGRTRPLHAAKTKEGLKGIKRKLHQLCLQIKTTVKKYLQDLDFGLVKLFFDWLRDKHHKTIRSANSIDTYWRDLKILYVRETGCLLDEKTRSDCLNYKNRIIQSWGLRKLPKRKPTGTTDFLYALLRFHWEKCPRAYADEKQRLYVSVVQLLAFVSGCRPVSILDTRAISQVKKRKTSERKQVAGSSKRLKMSSSLAKSQVSPVKNDNECNSGSDTSFPSNDGGDYSDTNPGYDSVDSLDDDADPMFDAESTLNYNNGAEESDGESGDESISKNDDASFIKDHIDDAYDAGPENTGALLWRHVQFHLVRSPVKDRRNILLAKITLLHTKAEERKPRVKTFTIGHHPDPVFDILGQLLALAIADGVFAANIQDVQAIYHYPIPPYLSGEPLKYRAKSLDQPVIRQSVNGSNGRRTSETAPMTYQRFYHYITDLGKEMCLKDRLTWYVWRRGLISAVNYNAPSSIRDQVADHDSEATAVKYYLNQQIQFDLQAVALDMASDEALDKASRSLLLDADPTAPIDLPNHLQTQFDNDPEILELAKKNMELWEAIRRLGFRTVLSAKGKTPLYKEKMAISRELNRQKASLRDRLMEQARQEHFRNAPTKRLNAFLAKSDRDDRSGVLSTAAALPPSRLLIEEREAFVEVIQQRTSDLSEDEIYNRRCSSIRLWVAMQGRREAGRIGKLKKQHANNTNILGFTRGPKMRQQSSQPPPSASFAVVVPVRRELHELQCPFCNADPGMDCQAQDKVWDRPNKLWDHVEKNVHKHELQAYSTGKKPCGLCLKKNVHFVPESIMHFKRHTLDVHGPRLRG